MKERDILRFEGPLGSFFLREESEAPMVLLASGTGFAPIKAIVEHAAYTGIQRPMTLYWGGRRPKDLYMHALCEQWARDLPNFKYVPVISDALPEDNWQGRTGFVHQAVIADHPDLSGHEVYACGAPVMINAARGDFTGQCKLHEDAFFADSFTSEADMHPAARPRRPEARAAASRSVSATMPGPAKIRFDTRARAPYICPHAHDLQPTPQLPYVAPHWGARG